MITRRVMLHNGGEWLCGHCTQVEDDRLLEQADLAEVEGLAMLQ